MDHLSAVAVIVHGRNPIHNLSSYQLRNLFGKPEAAAVQRELHAQLCRAIEASGEVLPDFIVEVSRSLAQ